VVRVTLEPGAVSPGDPNDPAGALFTLESGEVTIVIEQEWSISRSGAEFGTAETVPAVRKPPWRRGMWCTCRERGE
jgi:hypothetical protein